MKKDPTEIVANLLPNPNDQAYARLVADSRANVRDMLTAVTATAAFGVMAVTAPHPAARWGAVAAAGVAGACWLYKLTKMLVVYCPALAEQERQFSGHNPGMRWRALTALKQPEFTKAIRSPAFEHLEFGPSILPAERPFWKRF